MFQHVEAQNVQWSYLNISLPHLSYCMVKESHVGLEQSEGEFMMKTSQLLLTL